MKQMKVEELKLQNLHADPASVKRYNDLFDIMATYSIADTISILEGFGTEVDATIKKELGERKLDTLKIELL